jgi:hypothetical protein
MDLDRRSLAHPQSAAVVEIRLLTRPSLIVTSPHSAALMPYTTPLSICALTMSGLTTVPQSTAHTILRTWTSPDLVVPTAASDLFRAYFELFREQDGHRGVGALAHLDLRHDERDAAVGRDANERIRRERGWRRFHAVAEQQACACRGDGGHELASSQARHDFAACLIAARMRP